MTVSYSGNFFRLLLRWKGSIFRSVWKELVTFLLFFYIVRYSHKNVIEYLDPDGELNYKQKFVAMCKEFNEYTKLIPLTFLLGFYVANVVSRWWHQFECLCWPEDMLSLLCLVFPGSDLKSRQIRHQIARYINLTSALAWRDISSKIRLRFPHLRNIIDAGLLTELEYALLKQVQGPAPCAVWLTPLHWVQQILVREVRQITIGTVEPMEHVFIAVNTLISQPSHRKRNRIGSIGSTVTIVIGSKLDPEKGCAQINFLTPFTNELKTYRISFRKLYCHDWVCVPLVYTQVAALATYAYFFFCIFGRQFLDQSNELDLIVPVFTIVQFLFFVGWFKVGQDLMRPFGLDDDDIELSYILDRNIVISFAIVNTLESGCPRWLFDDDKTSSDSSACQSSHDSQHSALYTSSSYLSSTSPQPVTRALCLPACQLSPSHDNNSGSGLSSPRIHGDGLSLNRGKAGSGLSSLRNRDVAGDGMSPNRGKTGWLHNLTLPHTARLVHTLSVDDGRLLLAPFEEDVYWKHQFESKDMSSGSSLKWGRIDLSRTAHKHPPKRHTYLELKGIEQDDHSHDEEHTSCCSREKSNDRYITW